MSYGNLAYKLDAEEKIENPIKRVKAKAKPKISFQVIFGVLLVTMAAYFMISKNVMVYETNQEIKKLEKQLDTLESYTSQKMFELEQSVDLTTVEEVATTKLKMQRPEKYQTVYVNINGDDVTEVTADKVEGVKNTVNHTANSLKRNILGIFKMNWK